MTSKSRFGVGDFVSVNSGISPHCNTNRAKVINVKYIKATSGYRGWAYQTDNQPKGSGKWFRESTVDYPHDVMQDDIDQAPIHAKPFNPGVTRTTFL